MAEPTMRCELCGEVTPIDAIVDHVRLMHPDHYEGKPVVDTTLIDAMAEALTPAQYGTSMHWPYCRWSQCTGCLPPLPPMPLARPQFDLSLFRRPGVDRE